MDETVDDPAQGFRKTRLAAAAKRAGGNAALGRLLGYKDGAFVGQMLRGLRPITEKTIGALESKAGYKGWFTAAVYDASTGASGALTAAEKHLNDPYSEQLTLSPAERDLILALRRLPMKEQDETTRDVMHRAEVLDELVQRAMAEHGVSITGYATAARAAEKLPAPPPEKKTTLTHNAHSSARKERKS